MLRGYCSCVKREKCGFDQCGGSERQEELNRFKRCLQCRIDRIC